VYENGYGVVDVDVQQAIEWYRRAANQGHVGAQDRLAELTGEGRAMWALRRVLELVLR